MIFVKKIKNKSHKNTQFDLIDYFSNFFLYLIFLNAFVVIIFLNLGEFTKNKI